MATKKTEADLEARLHVVLEAAFPWLQPDALSHQTRFSVRLGRADIPIDGARVRTTAGRADIVVSSAGKHLAVVELKRADLPLTPDDLAQGLSYARLIVLHSTNSQHFMPCGASGVRLSARAGQLLAAGKLPRSWDAAQNATASA